MNVNIINQRNLSILCRWRSSWDHCLSFTHRSLSGSAVSANSQGRVFSRGCFSWYAVKYNWSDNGKKVTNINVVFFLVSSQFSDSLVYTSRGMTASNQFKVHGQLPLYGMTVHMSYTAPVLIKLIKKLASLLHVIELLTTVSQSMLSSATYQVKLDHFAMVQNQWLYKYLVILSQRHRVDGVIGHSCIVQVNLILLLACTYIFITKFVLVNI